MKDRKFLILIIINIGIVIGLIVAGFVLYSKYIKIPPPQPLLIPEPKDIATDPTFFLNQFENCLAGKEDPPLNPAGHWPDAIYTIVKALSQRNKEACLNLEEEQKEECLRYFYMFEMLTKSNADYCEELKPLMPSEIYSYCLAAAKNDISYCQQIENSLSKEICLALLGPDRCDYISGDFEIGDIKAYKMESFGVEGRKIKKEEQTLSEKDARSLCKKTVYFFKAIKEQNYTICNLSEIKKDSFATLLCQILSTLEPEKEWQNLRQKICYEKLGPTIALLKNDPSFCEKIPAKDDYNRELYNTCLAPIK